MFCWDRILWIYVYDGRYYFIIEIVYGDVLLIIFVFMILNNWIRINRVVCSIEYGLIIFRRVFYIMKYFFDSEYLIYNISSVFVEES